MARTFKGSANTVGELRTLLEQFPDDMKVRTRSLSHAWPVDLYVHFAGEPEFELLCLES